MSTAILISLASLTLGVLGLMLSRLVTRRVRVQVHRASFLDGGLIHGQECYFVTVTNLSLSREVEITHVWFHTPVSTHVLRSERPLPKRLKVDEAWTTWLPVDELPAELTEADVYKLARVRLSTGKVFKSKRNKGVPPFGAVPGGDSPVAPTGTIHVPHDSPQAEPDASQRRHLGHRKAFVCHATQDHPFVGKFAADLRTNGVDAWFSKWEIKAGDSIRAKIDEGLEGCEFFIIVLSKSSIGRPWVQTEFDAATIRKLNGTVRKIIPVKIEDCGDPPPTLASLCWEDFSNQPYEAALKRVLESIFEVDVRPPLGKNPSEPIRVDKVRPAFIAIQNQMAPDEAALLKAIADLTDGYHSFLRSLTAPSKQVLDRAIAAHKASQMERLRASFRRKGEDDCQQSSENVVF